MTTWLILTRHARKDSARLRYALFALFISLYFGYCFITALRCRRASFLPRKNARWICLYGDQRDLFARLRQINRHKVNRRWRERNRPRYVLYISLIREMNYVACVRKLAHTRELIFRRNNIIFFNVT